MRSAFFAMFCTLIVSACRAPPEPLALREPAELDRILDGYVDAGAYPFLYARLEDGAGRVLYEHVAVNRDLVPQSVAIDGNTWIRIWSMSKIVTIVTVLDLVEDGLLRIDDPVSKYIPEFAALQVAVDPAGRSLAALSAASWNADDAREAASALPCPLPTKPLRRPVTIADLLKHEAGFYYATTNIPCLDERLAAADLPTAIDSDDLVGRLADLPLIQQPGAGYFYGTNTTVLGVVAERATGKRLNTLVAERVTGPTGIDGLQYGLPDGVSLLPRYSGATGTLRVAADGELDIFGPNVPGYEPAHALYLGGEGMLATADGYSDFLRLLLARGELNGHRLLDAETIRALTAPQTQLDNPFGHDGYNLWVNNGRLADGSQGRGGLWIGGGYEGTHFWIDPEYGFVGVIMTQVYAVPRSAWGRDDRFRESVYDQLLVDGEAVR